MTKRLSLEEWEAARIAWESDLTQTDESIASKIGLSKAAVVKKRHQQKWCRVGTLQNVQERAQFTADLKSKLGVNEVTPKNGSIDRAVEIRADVLDRHRADWAEHRNHFTIAGIAADFELGKSAKITAEMLKIRQEGERKAYGLDDSQAAQPVSEPVQIRIVRATKPDD